MCACDPRLVHIAVNVDPLQESDRFVELHTDMLHYDEVSLCLRL